MFNNKLEEKMAEDVSNTSNSIGKGTTLTGNIETYGNLRIEGKVKGDIKSKSKIVLGKSSYIEGNILAQNADIEGEVSGTIEIVDILVLKPSAKIKGNIKTNKFIIESGAQFNGQCKMGQVQKEIKLGEPELANSKTGNGGSVENKQAKKDTVLSN
ncbi:polymer-forming cytoskeletal protein [Fulvivirgaceae bacterium BMA10]|uniref:Polymer-forming cytoskeletal protein n=1 Tax=Splendidivirga corallicola TaxID=3051826 RepID=A0ABT8KIX7_9BACT|nr:polymer-forming cytoskeletal protein [Fulvivirgaceae bacterium BMA10]